MSTASAELERERRGGVEIWRLNRPDRRNALSVALVRELSARVETAERDAELRAVILSGRGAAFCTGADLKERAGMSRAEITAFLDELGEALLRIDRFPRPVIAALHGHVLGGGLELALACDFRVASEDAVLGLPEVALGVIPGAGGTQRLTRLLGEGRAKAMIVRAQRWDAARALREGLVHEVAADAPKAALALAEELAAGAPIAIAAALEAIDGASASLEEGLVLERRNYLRTLATEDRTEALAAFAERRRPRFRGR